ncbi:hypothetical protein EVAR_56085_1 [Eumeta japonica]|uniref:Zinc finger BED domain-containing protein 5 n=1 Tax=Eumeta variegata TaxID=151549 RepID=A0A4C1YRF5_EUMVA|nr:hypothetical protein EVAR_56085_1 [Eumeta japonica]
MHDEKSAKHLSTVPLSNDTVSRRIHDLASYVKQELVTRLHKTRFALQMDESTDVAGLAILLVIDVRTGEFIRNLVELSSGGSGGVVWRVRVSATELICAVGFRSGTEETKLLVLDFDVPGA